MKALLGHVPLIAFPDPLPTSRLGSRLMLQAGLDNKAAAALLLKPPQSGGDRLSGEMGPLADGRRLMLQAGLDSKAAGAAALPPKPPQPRSKMRPWEMGPLPD